MIADDRRRELEDERDRLLRSLRDLDEQRGAGELTEADHAELRDLDVARAAEVLREIERLEAADDDAAAVAVGGAGDGQAPAARRRGGGKVVAVTVAGLLLVGAVAGGVLASTASEREGDAPVTGAIPRGTTARLAKARELIGQGKVVDAIKTYDAILAEEPGEPEALAYRGWMVRLAGRKAQDVALIDTGLASIERAVLVDPSYPDARFFRGMVLWQDKGDPDAAVRDFEAFLSSNPPADMVTIVQDALERARAEAVAKAGAAPTTTSPAP